PVALKVRPEGLVFRPGAGGLSTLMLTLTLTAVLPAGTSHSRYEVAYKDSNFAERTGWKEIIAVPGKGADLIHCSASATDISPALTVYPTDPTLAPPQVTEAYFTVAAGSGTILSSAASETSPLSLQSISAPQSPPRPRTPQDVFTQTIAA